MIGPMKVDVQIESNIDGERITQHIEGDVYPKESHYYLRYEEPSAELKGTVTTIRLEHESIRIIRQGGVRSEQTFVCGKRLRGYYDTPQGRLELETETRTLAVDLTEGLGTVEWSYVLYAMGEASGAYRLKLTISAR
ncbi:DUF1934 domain-containing protein [Paenibacillus piri]|uniref:DUF1934 domain-containing protein n=1 Tax=Paenibacillus piri TaxID=2547395 RepID=A0A4R5KAE9_9BACL|nr:DUF1934 domain-containing protein [Paenibacillus piri]TDF92183.1 DUF1934 domain-containing protein [Paenibacillus piri]